MAWRIDKAVVRGEIDNRTRGRVSGHIWFTGRHVPVTLELAGNCWRDLAGRRLEFTNPEPKTGDLRNIAQVQRGAVGDITASRKVKVLEFPLEQMHLYYKTGKAMPWHWGNSLYLEWFSEGNGRVVIESSAFNLKIVGEASWEMSDAEEIEQREGNGRALTAFMDRLVEAAGPPDREVMDDTPAAWELKPQTEAEAEAQQARSDLLMDRIEARINREGEAAEYEKILEEELERLRRERGEPEPTPDPFGRNAEWLEEMARAAEDTLAQSDPELEAGLRYEHPLVRRVSDLALTMRRAAGKSRWWPKGATHEHPVRELLDATMIAGPKLAGALNGQHWPPGLEFCAHTIVRLKRARGYLEDARRAADACREDKLIPAASLGSWVQELNNAAVDTDVLIAELRAKLDRGTD